MSFYLLVLELDGYKDRLTRGEKFVQQVAINSKRVEGGNFGEMACEYAGIEMFRLFGTLGGEISWKYGTSMLAVTLIGKCGKKPESIIGPYAFNRNNSCTVGDIFSHLCTRNKRVISRNRNSKLSRGQSLGKYGHPLHLYSSKVYIYIYRDIREIEAFCHS